MQTILTDCMVVKWQIVHALSHRNNRKNNTVNKFLFSLETVCVNFLKQFMYKKRQFYVSTIDRYIYVCTYKWNHDIICPLNEVFSVERLTFANVD